MATVRVFKSSRSQEIEDEAIVSGLVDSNGHLILSKNNGNTVDAGYVKGPQGDQGDQGTPGADNANVNVVGDTIIMRTNDGRAKAATPVESDDLATKAYTDTKVITRLQSISSSMTPSDFQQGVTIGVTGTGVWPTEYGTILTVKESNGRVFQQFVDKLSGESWMRGVNTDGTAWNPWGKLLTEEKANAVFTPVVIPSSVAVSSGTASVSSDGLITFTGCSSIGLNGLFAGDPGEVYELTISSQGSTANYQYLRTRNAGVNVTSAGYNRVGIITGNSSGPTRSSQFGDTVLAYLFPSTAAAPNINARVTIFTPNVTGKHSQVHVVSLSAASDRFLWQEYGQGNKGDGLALACTAGTITGTMRIRRIG